MNIHKEMVALEMFIVPVSADDQKVRRLKFFFNESMRQRPLESKGFHTTWFIRDILGHNENK